MAALWNTWTTLPYFESTHSADATSQRTAYSRTCSARKTLFKLFIFEVVFVGDDSSQHKTKSYKIVYVIKIMCKRLHKKQT